MDGRGEGILDQCGIVKRIGEGFGASNSVASSASSSAMRSALT